MKEKDKEVLAKRIVNVMDEYGYRISERQPRDRAITIFTEEMPYLLDGLFSPDKTDSDRVARLEQKVKILSKYVHGHQGDVSVPPNQREREELQ